MPKYSVLVPIRRGANYINSIVHTVINQDFDDYELIISDNFSTDGSAEILAHFKDDHIRVIRPPHAFSMSEHWEWLLSQSKGIWIIFLGVDDGLFTYSFELAEKLTEVATLRGVRSIMSKRAYYFWPGCEALYGNRAVSYTALNKVEIRKTKVDFLDSLIGKKSYFDLPQMYSNSLFERSLLMEAIEKQSKIFTSISPDANLAAIACSIEKKYLLSHIPLGWVGTSPASNGLSGYVTINCKKNRLNTRELSSSSNDFYKLNNTSKLIFDLRAGDPKYAGASLFLWEAVLKTQSLRPFWLNRIFLSKLFVILVLSKELLDIDINLDNAKMTNWMNIAKINEVNFSCIRHVVSIRRIFKNIRRFVVDTLIFRLGKQGYRTIYNALNNKNIIEVFNYSEIRTEDSDISMQEANRNIAINYLKYK